MPARDEDEDDRPRDRGGPSAPNGLAVAGLVAGVASLCLPPVALLLSGVGLARAGSRDGTGRGLAIGGLATGGLALVLLPVLIALLIPAVRKVREAAARLNQTNNFVQVGVGANAYESAAGHVPTAVARDPAGLPGPGAPPDPATRLGWRAELLPYIGQAGLYTSLDFGRAWDSPKNAPAVNTPVKQYSDPADAPTNQTRARGFTGSGALFDPDPAFRVRVADITDGPANTILYAESTQTVPWAQNNEMPFAPNGSPPALGHPNRAVFLAAFADGSVRMIRKDVSPAALRAAVTYAGGETLPLE